MPLLRSPKFEAEIAIAKNHLERARAIALDELPDEVLYESNGRFNSTTEEGMLLITITYVIAQLKGLGY